MLQPYRILCYEFWCCAPQNENRAMHYAATMATPELVDFLIGIDPDSACAANDVSLSRP